MLGVCEYPEAEEAHGKWEVSAGHLRLGVPEGAMAFAELFEEAIATP